MNTDGVERVDTKSNFLCCDYDNQMSGDDK